MTDPDSITITLKHISLNTTRARGTLTASFRRTHLPLILKLELLLVWPNYIPHLSKLTSTFPTKMLYLNSPEIAVKLEPGQRVLAEAKQEKIV